MKIQTKNFGVVELKICNDCGGELGYSDHLIATPKGARPICDDCMALENAERSSLKEWEQSRGVKIG